MDRPVWLWTGFGGRRKVFAQGGEALKMKGGNKTRDHVEGWWHAVDRQDRWVFNTEGNGGSAHEKSSGKKGQSSTASLIG